MSIGSISLQLQPLTATDADVAVNGNTVTWCTDSKIRKSVSVDWPVIHTEWAYFSSSDTSRAAEPCLVIAQKRCLTVLGVSGSTYTVTLPFPIQRAFGFGRCGLLLQRDIGSVKSDGSPQIFSLLHPLCEPHPICLDDGDVVSMAEEASSDGSRAAAPTLKLLHVAKWGSRARKAQCAACQSVRSIALTCDSATGIYAIFEIRHEPSTEDDMSAPIDPPLRPQIALHELWSGLLFANTSAQADKAFDSVLRDGSLCVYVIHRNAQLLECLRISTPTSSTQTVIHGSAMQSYRTSAIACKHMFQIIAIDATCVDALAHARSRFPTDGMSEDNARMRADLPRSDLVVVHPVDGVYIHQGSERLVRIAFTPMPQANITSTSMKAYPDVLTHVRSIAAAGSATCVVGIGEHGQQRFAVEFHLAPRSSLVQRVFAAFEILAQRAETHEAHTETPASADVDGPPRGVTTIIQCPVAPTCLAMLRRLYHAAVRPVELGCTPEQSDWCVLEEALCTLFQCGEMSTDMKNADSAWDSMMAMAEGNIPPKSTCSISADDASALEGYFGSVFFVLHAVYEDSKLNTLLDSSRRLFARLLARVSRALGLHAYTTYYVTDGIDVTSSNPVVPADIVSTPSTATVTSLLAAAGDAFPDAVVAPPRLRPWLHVFLRGATARIGFPVVSQTPLQDTGQPMFLAHAVGAVLSRLRDMHDHEAAGTVGSTEVWSVVDSCAAQGLTRAHMQHLPLGVAAPLEGLVRRAVLGAHNGVSAAQLWAGRAVVGADLWDVIVARRVELANNDAKGTGSDPTTSPAAVADDDADDDGTAIQSEHIRRRFASDLRVKEVQRLLVASKPVRVRTEQTPEMSDHDFAAEQKAQLLLTAQRTLATSVGRGMFTLNTIRPIITQAIRVPPLNTSGKGLHGASISLEDTTLTAELMMWPRFHNGVAAGLRVARPAEANVSTNWIAYHRPKDNQLSDEHAGFIMALGMLGHLQNISAMSIYNYLTKGHDTTSVGVLLGMAAAAQGTMDPVVAKMLSIHIPALLPPTTADIEVSLMVQSAAVVGVGLLYQETCHRRITQVLVDEIGRTNTDNDDTDLCRESYALGAGLALGMVTLGRGGFAGIADLHLSDRLRRYMDGDADGTTPRINVDITGPGATLALGLAYLKTHNAAIAARLEIPSTEYQLDFIRPDCVLLRVLSRSLVLWDAIEPTTDWVEGNCPVLIRHFSGFTPKSATDAPETSSVDTDLMRNAYVNVCAGSCLAIALRYAGSCDARAAQSVMYYMMLLTKSERLFAHTGRSVLQSCTNVVLIALALVHAGSGDLPTMRLVRKLHKRVTPDVTYGNHMAVHAALGLLFLGGGACTIDTSTNAGIAAIIASLFPQFPNSPVDNRYHLQALRHMYALATVRKSTGNPHPAETLKPSLTASFPMPLTRAYDIELVHRVHNLTPATAHDLHMLLAAHRIQGTMAAGDGDGGPRIYSAATLAMVEEVVHRRLQEVIPAVAAALRTFDAEGGGTVAPADDVATFLAYHEIPSVWYLWQMQQKLRATSAATAISSTALFVKGYLPAVSTETVLAVAAVVQAV